MHKTRLSFISRFEVKDSLCRFLLQNVFLKVINIFVFFVFFVVFSFSGSILREKSQIIFLLSREANFYAPAWTSAKFYCGNKMRNPKLAVSPHLACSGSQSEHRITTSCPLTEFQSIFSRYGMSKVWGLQCVISGWLGSTYAYLSFEYIKRFFAVQGHSTAISFVSM